MSVELIAMLGGGVTGFVMKLLATQAQSQTRLFEQMMQRQEMADNSADRAKARGGVMMRRLITCVVLFAIVIVPTVIAFTDVGVSLQKETNGFLGLFKGTKWETIGGYVILPEVRQTALAMVGFYYGSSQVK